MSETPVSKPRRVRLTAFRRGVLFGVLSPFVAMLALHWVVGPPLRFNVQVISVGHDVSTHGGVKVAISSEYGRPITQTCNGPCDDLWVNTVSGDDTYSVKVLDAAGRCVACGGAGYVTNGFLTRITVAGESRLQIVENSAASGY